MIIVASNNQGKIREFKEILDGFELSSLKDNNIEIEVEEDGTSYLENSCKKAYKIQLLTHQTVMADDSGFEIEALGNFPGIFSARYASDKSYLEKCNILLDKMKNIENRKARFVCAIVIIDKDGTRYQGTGIVNGTLAYEYRGNNGFGYDPIFIPEGYNQTLAEMDEETKNKLSHRFLAVQDLLTKLPTKFIRRHRKC